jgi:6-phosphogluconolactonase (cycloisomerase 2 family)
MSRLRASGARGALALIIVAGVLVWAPGAAWAGSAGLLSQLAGSAGCVHDVTNNPAGDGCLTARELGKPASVVVSPDGKDLYSLGYGNGGASGVITAFARAGDGSLSQLAGPAGCLATGVAGCGSVRSFVPDVSAAIAISPDGRNVYASSGTPAAVIVLRRSADGSLSQLAGAAGCVSEDGTDGHGGVCTTARAGIDFQAMWIVASPDGRTVYAGGTSINTIVAVFVRNADGSLTVPAGAAGCVSADGTDFVGGVCATSPAGAPSSAGMAISADGKFAYVISGYTESIDRYARDTNSGALTGLDCVVNADQTANSPGCALGRELQAPRDVALSPDATSLYVASNNATNNGVAVFSRNPTTGSIAQASSAGGCLSLTGQDGETVAGPCAKAIGLFGVASIAAAPDGHSVYTAGINSDLAVFDRAGDGTLTQPAGTAGCHAVDTNTDGCTGDRAMDGLQQVLVSPDGRDAYAAASSSLLVFARGAPPPPVQGKSVDVGLVSGTVLVKQPRQTKFQRLTATEQIPVGSTVDTTHGRVRLASAVNAHGATQTTDFYAGGFRVTQAHGRALTTLRLTGGHSSACPHAASADLGPQATIARRHPRRRLWGNGKGSYSTRGASASATVQGTIWLTEDDCEGTLVRVRRGVVLVRDLVRHRTIKVSAPHSYFAANRRP